MSSSLVTVHNQNENVYIQHRHNGENPGLDSMIGAWKDYLSGLTENQADLGSGLETNQITGKMKTVCTL